MKWRKTVTFVSLFVVSLVVGSIFLFRWSATWVQSTCTPSSSIAEVLAKVDDFNADLSPFKQLTLREDEVTRLFRQSLPESACITITQRTMMITIPGDWFAYELTLRPLEQEPYWFLVSFRINTIAMPASIVEQNNQQIQKAWRDFSYDLAAKRVITKVAISEGLLVIDGEIPPPPN